MDDNYRSNAFIVSRLGQLRNVHTLIEQKSLEHNVLIILYVKGDRTLLSNIKHAYREELFDGVLYLGLPEFPLRLNKKKSERIYNSMAKILSRLHEDFFVKDLYICNIDNYYYYLERIIEEHDYPFSINLFEEGLTTYKITSGESLRKKEKPANKNDVRKAWREFRKSLRRFAVNTVVLIVQCASYVIRMPLLKPVHNLWVRLTVDKSRRYGMIHNFNSVYVCFPEMVFSGGSISFNSIEKLNFKFSLVEDEDLKSLAEGYSTIFINQKYVNYVSHFRILFRILDEMGIDRLMIKLHPKENAQKVASEILKAQMGYEHIDVKILSSIGQIPVEDFIYSYGIRRVIGLISSSLIYIRSGLDDVEVISIADRYRQLCGLKDSGVASRELVQFDDEYRFFKKFEGITQFVPEVNPEHSDAAPETAAGL